MKILHLNRYGEGVGGTEAYISEVTRAMAQAGPQSHLVYFAPVETTELIPESTYISLSHRSYVRPQDVRALEQIIDRLRPDVAFLHGVYNPGVIDWVVDCLPTVAYVHSPYVVCPGSAQYLRTRSVVCPHRAGLICLVNAQIERCCWGRNPIRHLIKLRRVRAFTEVYRRIDNILVGSRFMMDLLVRSGIVPDQVSVVPPIFATQPMPEYRPVEESKTVLFGGRLVKEKGLHLLIRALARIPTRWELIVAGDGDERENLALLVDQMGVGDKVRFVGWVRSRDLSDYMSTCTCVAVPSLWPEPFGRMGPEAFMHGRPVVAFSVGGIPDWLEHERSGLLVEPGNVDGLELALRRLLASAELCAQMGHYGRRVARSQWRPQIQVERLLDVFERAQQQFWDRR